MSTTDGPVLTAEEFQLLPPVDLWVELVRGKVVATSLPTPRHGLFCGNAAFLLTDMAHEHSSGRVATHVGIITGRNPDTVRAADICFYSYERVPEGRLPDGYLAVAPDLVIDVRSNEESWTSILERVADYLSAGVLVVAVLDPVTKTLPVFRPQTSPSVLSVEDELSLAEFFPAAICVPVSRFFAE